MDSDFNLGLQKMLAKSLRYGHLCAFFGAKLVILGPIDFLFGLPINLIVNAWQNKFEVDILKNVAKIANLRPKIGQIPLLSLDIKWYNSIICHPILTVYLKLLVFTRRIECCPNQSSISFG